MNELNPYTNLMGQRVPIQKSLALYLVAIVLVGAAMPLLGTILLGLAGLHALRGPRESIEALGILIFGIALNKTLVPIDYQLTRWIVLGAAAVRAAWDTVIGGRSIPPAFWPLTWLFGVIVVTSGVASWLPTVSLLKATSFYLGVGAILLSAFRSREERTYWHRFLFTLAVIYLVGSVPIYFMEAGFARSEGAFQGLTNHPQTYGVLGAMLTAFAISFVWTYRSGILGVLTVVSGLLGLYVSGSRTGMLAILVCGLALLVIASTRKDLDVASFLPKSTVAWGVVLTVSVPFLVINGVDIARGVIEFLGKGDEFEGLFAAFFESRGRLIRASWSNFLQQPITGIGLGVPSDLAQATIDYGPLDIPISARVEKGFAPSALLEEVGLVGATFFVALLWKLVAPVVREGGDSTLLWVTLVGLVVNMGEAVIFALGGNGLIVWLVVGLAYALSVGPSR